MCSIGIEVIEQARIDADAALFLSQLPSFSKAGLSENKAHPHALQK